MWCFNKRVLVPITIVFVMGVFVYGASYIQNTKVITDNRAQDISPSPTLLPRYPSVYGVKFEESNSNLPIVRNLIRIVMNSPDSVNIPYIPTIPSTFRLGIYPNNSNIDLIDSFILQTDTEEYPNMMKDRDVITYFNSLYPTLYPEYIQTGGLPVQNFCHLASLANMLKVFNLESKYVRYANQQLANDDPLKSVTLTLPETIFYRHYRTRNGNSKYTYKVDSKGIMGKDIDFMSILTNILRDIEVIDSSNYQFIVNDIHSSSGSKVSLGASDIFTIESEISTPNTLYIARVNLNNWRYKPTSLFTSVGAAHYLVIIDAKNFNFNNANKTSLFVIDSLGDIISQQNQSYYGSGYIGWTGLSYFHGERKNIEDNKPPITPDSVEGRIPGIFNLFLIRNAKVQPTPTPKGKVLPKVNKQVLPQMK